MSNQKDSVEVKDPPVESADFEDLDYTAFLKWDEWSEKIASSGQMTPPWFRQKGLDDGEVLLFSPVPERIPDGADEKEYNDSRWDHPGSQIAEVCGPTKKIIAAVLNAKDPVAKDRANVDLVAQCLVKMPEGSKARRPFRLAGVTVLGKGADLIAPQDFLEKEDLPDGVKGSDCVMPYVTEFLPDVVRKYVHTAALCMAVPEIEFVILKGQEKDADKPASLRKDGHPPKLLAEDENFIEASSGSSEQS